MGNGCSAQTSKSFLVLFFKKELLCFLGVAACACLTACATLPNVAPEIAQAAADRPTDPAQTQAVMQLWGEKIAQRPFLDGNDVHLARNGPRVLPALQDAIGSAHTRIDMESYEFKGDEGEIFSSLLTPTW
jgi:cardiolipin synthase